MELKEIIKKYLQKTEEENVFSPVQRRKGNLYYLEGNVQLLTHNPNKFEFLLVNENDSFERAIEIEDGEHLVFSLNKEKKIDEYTYATILQLLDELSWLEHSESLPGRKYTREGMVQRVLQERKQKALKNDYRIKFADNIFGEHTLWNEKGVKYKITLRDFERETGYVNSIDLQTNKLGTTKHIMFAFHKLKSDKKLYSKLSKTYPFVEIFLDPLNNYKITWFYPQYLEKKEHEFINRYFNGNLVIEDDELEKMINFFEEAKNFSHIKIRPEVYSKVESFFENTAIENLKHTAEINWGKINAVLFPYQKQGVEFSLFKKGSIIADEMGLGKTLQAISTAVLKKDIFGFTHTLVICPASLKYQWKSEIEKFCNEKALVIEGKPEEREMQYKHSDEFFFIVNYETAWRDLPVLKKMVFDFVILDEAQRIKNYETKTSNAIKAIPKNHSLVITGTPIENKLIDLYSIVAFIDPFFLAPLWEFSYQHCLFDHDYDSKIIGYYNLNELKERLKQILIRREKRDVIKELPQVSQYDVPITLHPEQESLHGNFAHQLSRILHKKYYTAFDMQRIMMLLTSMRMVCDSTNLIDEESSISPKLDELEFILTEKMDLKNQDKKIIIFSEWIRMNKLIGQMLRKNGIGFAELNGNVPTKHRGKLIEKFEQSPECKVFLSTESGGSGLNLQVADTVINFELPWNPAKKNQRIGRIDRLGQRNKQLTVINFIARKSIEESIRAGLVLKQDLFSGVLNESSPVNLVDFSNKGKSQFIKQLQETFLQYGEEEKDEEIEEVAEYTEDDEIIEQNNEEPIQPDSPQEEILKAEYKEAEKDIAQKETSGTVNVEQDSNQEKNVKPVANSKQEKARELEQVLNQGMGFLSGIYKMTTGSDMASEGQKISINEETGEVTMTFKLPGF